MGAFIDGSELPGTTEMAVREASIHRPALGATFSSDSESGGTIGGSKAAPDRRANVDRSLAKSPPISAKTREVSMATPKNSPAIAPADHRHGTNPGYNAGCRAECCRRAHMVWMKRYRMYGADELIDATGTHRRIQALVALGHTLYDLSVDLGMTTRYAGKVLLAKKVRPATAEAVDDLYERLSMTRPNGWIADRARTQAALKGYAPPLAWDDIDNPESVPAGVVRLAKCGTDSAYKRHLRYGETPCDPCREAHRNVRAAERKVA